MQNFVISYKATIANLVLFIIGRALALTSLDVCLLGVCKESVF